MHGRLCVPPYIRHVLRVMEQGLIQGFCKGGGWRGRGEAGQHIIADWVSRGRVWGHAEIFFKSGAMRSHLVTFGVQRVAINILCLVA